MTVSKATLARSVLCIALVISWWVMLYHAWQAFSTLPTPERLEHSRMARIPSLGAVGWLVLRSAGETAVLTALAWPARRRYATRLTAAIVLLPVWFITTAPLTLSLMEWVHRRWLAGVWLVLLAALLITVVARGVRRASTAS